MALQIGYQPRGYVNYAQETGSHFSLDLVLREVSLAGFVGLEIGGQWGLGTPEECRETLARYGLRLAAMPVILGQEVDWEGVLAKARFLEALGARQMMVCGGFWREEGRKPTPEELRAFARTCEDLARRVADHGVRAGFHNHLGSLVEREDELDFFLEETEAMGYYPDLGHARAAGWDPLPSLRRHGARIVGAHLKDVLLDPVTGAFRRFVELGKGNAGLDLGACLKELERHLDGWAFVEQDHTSFNPGLDALENYRYLRARGYLP